MSKYHAQPIRIYFEDTDAGGIVYHSNFFKFAERGRTELLRECGYSSTQLRAEEGTILVARHASIDYLKPAVLDDELEMRTSFVEMKNSSFILQQDLYKNDEPLCQIKITMVCVKHDTMRPVRVPEALRSVFKTYLD